MEVHPSCQRALVITRWPPEDTPLRLAALEAQEGGTPRRRFHDLRHTAITELAEAGAPDATLMAITGHMSRRMLEHYSHVRMQAKREVLAKLSSGLMSTKPEGLEKAAEVN